MFLLVLLVLVLLILLWLMSLALSWGLCLLVLFLFLLVLDLAFGLAFLSLGLGTIVAYLSLLIAEVDIMQGVEKEGMKLYGSLGAMTSRQSTSLASSLEDPSD